jgi:hypothetical protein
MDPGTPLTSQDAEHYLFTVKLNQKGLYAALHALSWAGASRHATRD